MTSLFATYAQNASESFGATRVLSVSPRLRAIHQAQAATVLLEAMRLARVDPEAPSAPDVPGWRHSIVDLMKLVGMDSSLASRKALAAELKFTGDTADSATMNIWLHKQVLQKLAENGGRVPQELLG